MVFESESAKPSIISGSKVNDLTQKVNYFLDEGSYLLQFHKRNNTLIATLTVWGLIFMLSESC